jgi:MraZ protein
MLIGEFSVTMDVKGRLMIPAKLRSQIAGNVLWATKGVDDNLWLYTPEEWAIFAGKVMDNASPFSEGDRDTCRSIIAPAQDLEIDSARRILIPPTLKQHAGLKREVVILGVVKFIEVWDAEAYASHMKESKERGIFKENQNKLKERIFF